jgi:N-acetylglucosaminyldiphosphoundecaprenol N-acetyl-beta-D-mannosaminyltransferase
MAALRLAQRLLDPATATAVHYFAARNPHFGSRQPSSAQASRTMNIMGVRVDDIGAADIVARALDAIDRRDRVMILNVNANLINLAATRPWLRELFRRAEIVFCDGAGVQLASLMLFGLLPRRTTPPEWVGRLADGLAARGGSLFWLGGAPDVVERAAAVFERRHKLRTAGCHHGFFDAAAGSADNCRLIAEINAARPSLLLVNMGMPRQERWLYDHWHSLDAGIAVSAGALVDHVAGRVRRPPHWVANIGLEWAVRLAIEPRRLWRRYLIGLPIFGCRLLREKFAPRVWE